MTGTNLQFELLYTEQNSSVFSEARNVSGVMRPKLDANQLVVVRNGSQFSLYSAPGMELLHTWQWQGINQVNKPFLATSFDKAFGIVRVSVYQEANVLS